MSIEVLQAHYGFTRIPFGRDLAPQMLHRSAGHGEAVARINWCISERALGVITALYHDFGYLKKRSDRRHRYGAEYTLSHVTRGSRHLGGYLPRLGLRRLAMLRKEKRRRRRLAPI